MFGLRYQSVPAASAATPSRGNLPVIATVSAGSPEYAVALIDVPVIDGVPTYHLGLTPLRNPKANRLRELWVGTGDYLPRRAFISGNFTRAPLVDVPWTVEFAIIDGAPYITREIASDTLFLAHRRVVRQANIAFQDIHESTGSLYDVPLVTPEARDDALVEP